jgi:hypothetical protein
MPCKKKEFFLAVTPLICGGYVNYTRISNTIQGLFRLFLIGLGFRANFPVTTLGTRSGGGPLSSTDLCQTVLIHL